MVTAVPQRVLRAGSLVYKARATTARHAETFETRTAQAHLDSIKREFELLWDEGRIWVLLICNLVSTSLQLAVDAYLSLGVGGKTRECDSMFFDDNGGLFEQSLRLVISTGTYLVPNWGALYVFYVLPRFQFSTVLDVPGLLMDDECDEAAYELLSGDERVKTIRHITNYCVIATIALLLRARIEEEVGDGYALLRPLTGHPPACIVAHEKVPRHIRVYEEPVDAQEAHLNEGAGSSEKGCSFGMRDTGANRLNQMIQDAVRFEVSGAYDDNPRHQNCEHPSQNHCRQNVAA
uniref:Uncharacterized protein n=1 Tax=Phytophthora ramorum TaxID=164328 RepID=H3GW06_PHYRM